MYFGLPANDVCSNVLLFIDNVEKLKVACCKKLTSRTMRKTQEVGIESFVCNDLRPSELYRPSTIDHPNSTVHRPSTIAFQKTCIGHRTSKFRTSLDFGGRSQNGTTFEMLDLCPQALRGCYPLYARADLVDYRCTWGLKANLIVVNK